MRLSGDLGFSGPVLLLFAVLLVGFAARRKWRTAATRREEIRRLVVLAADEAAWAEMEAVMEYAQSGALVRNQCAVCFSPTTTRCSRCKAVRYCSGRCQIVHWRQGHKEQCHPPSSIAELESLERNCVQDSVDFIVEEPRFKEKNLDARRGSFTELSENFSKEQVSSRLSYSSQPSSGKDTSKVEFRPVKVPAESGFCNTSSSGNCFLSDPHKVELKVDGTVPNTSCGQVKLPELNDCVDDVHQTGQTKSVTFVSASALSSVNNISSSNKVKEDIFNSSTISPSGSEVSSVCTIDASAEASVEQTKVTVDLSLPPISAKDNPDESDYKSFLRFSFDLSAHGVPLQTHILDGPNRSNCQNGQPLDLEELSSCETLSSAPNESLASMDALETNDITRLSSHSEKHVPLARATDDGYKLSSMNMRPKAFTQSETCKVYKSRSQNDKSALAEKATREAFVYTSQPGVIYEKSSPLASGHSNVESVLKPRGQRSLSFGSSNDWQHSRGTGRHSVSGVAPSKVDWVNKGSNGSASLSDTTIPSLSGTNALKISMRKVVQQFRSSKLSKHYNQPSFGSEITGNYNHKIHFAYDLFTKLWSWDKVDLQPCGLMNCGNSCYANAVLQCLSFTRPLTAYLLQGFHSKTCVKKAWCFTCEFETLLYSMKQTKSPLSPSSILSQINLGHGKEEDAHEFLRYAIDAMQSACLEEAVANGRSQLAQETTLIQLTFGGFLKSRIKCMKCLGKSERCERIMDLTVEISGDISTLEEALYKFTSTETLEGENKYQCSRCNSYEKAKKKLTILEAPNVLTIALKRFQSGKFGKLNKTVKFPEVLNLAPYMSDTSDKSPIYGLYAVVVHLDIMNAAFSGHYISYVKSAQGKWYKIDDSQVKPVEVDRVLSKGAYMLLYARCSPRAPALIRNSMVYDSRSKRTKCTPPITSCSDEKASPKARSNSSLRKCNDHQRQEATSEVLNSALANSSDGRPHPAHWIPKVDSCSDNSSLFSCSDEGSCSTDSTRDSMSIDDHFEFVLGDSGRFSSYSPLRSLDEPEVSSSPFSNPSPLSVSSGSHDYGYSGSDSSYSEGREPIWAQRSSSSMFSDTTKQCRTVGDKISSCSSSETDWDIIGSNNPPNVNSVVTLRRCRERTQTPFY